MFTNILLYFVNVFLVISVIFTVFSTNPVFGLIFLIFSFVLALVFLLLLNCEFFGFMFLMIYVGGIIILFLFVIMLLDIKFKDLTKNLMFNNIVALGLFFLFGLSSFYFKIFLNQYEELFLNSVCFINWKNLNNFKNDIKIYSILLYTNFVFQFLLIGFILLLALIGSVFFINVYVSTKIRIQNSFKQISVHSNFF